MLFSYHKNAVHYKTLALARTHTLWCRKSTISRSFVPTSYDAFTFFCLLLFAVHILPPSLLHCLSINELWFFSTFFIFGNGASRFFKHFFLRILHQIFNSLLSWSRFPTCYCYNRAEVFDKAIAKLVQQYLESRSVRVLENKKAVAGINVRNYNGKCWNITHSTIRTHMGKNIPF